MDTRETFDRRNQSHSVEMDWIWAPVGFAGRLLRGVAFGVLRLLEPLVLPLLFWLAIGGLGLWVIFVWIAHDPGFPTARVLLMSLGCLFGFVGYCGALEWLRPTAR
jgi:hypothetical protein